jgi:hypothetical protein
LINDVFLNSMGPGNKLKQSEEALKKSNYLLKKSMQAALGNKTQNSSTSGLSLRPEFIKGEPSSLLDRGKSNGTNFENELAKMPLPTQSKKSNCNSEMKKYGADIRTPPSLLSSIFVQKIGLFYILMI